MEEMELRTYTKDKTIVQVACGIGAVKVLLDLLWQDKTNIQTSKVAYDTKEKTITVKQFNLRYNELIYVFSKVPLQWDGNLDTLTLQKQIYNQIVEEVK